MITHDEFIKVLEDNPIIVAVKDQKALQTAIASQSQIIFLLTSNLFSVEADVNTLKENGKIVFVHFDLIDGLSKNFAALKYLTEQIKPDGIISTKPSIITAAKKMGLLTIQRHFIVDSISLASSIEAVKDTKPTAVEILPGVVYKAIEEMRAKTTIPVIAGGLISDKEEVIHCLNKGVAAISSTSQNLWEL